MRLSFFTTCVLMAVFAGPGYGQASPGRSGVSESVWTVDLIRTLPGRQREYLRNIESNWSGAREMAIERGAIMSYRALAAPPDSARGWDIILLTEYRDSTAWSEREEIFTAIFESPEFDRVEMELPSSELREFVASGVKMWGVAPPPSR